MSPAMVELLLQILVTYGPAAYKAVVELVNTANPTKEDCLKVLDFALQKNYDDYISGGKP